jgi:hypothetical protein
VSVGEGVSDRDVQIAGVLLVGAAADLAVDLVICTGGQWSVEVEDRLFPVRVFGVGGS